MNRTGDVMRRQPRRRGAPAAYEDSIGPRSTAVLLHRSWIPVAVAAWHAIICGRAPSAESRRWLAHGLVPPRVRPGDEPWIVLHLADGMRLIHWIDGSSRPSVLRADTSGYPLPRVCSLPQSSCPPSIALSGCCGLPPTLPMEGCFAHVRRPLDGRAGTIRVGAELDAVREDVLVS